MCYALHAVNQVDQKIQHISLTAAVSTRQHPSESSGVYCDDKCRFVSASLKGHSYHRVSLEVMSILFGLPTKKFGFGADDRDTIS